MEIPVYLFTGFLESGKTTFIQEALEGADFNGGGERTLLLLCEEGEEEFHRSKFYDMNVFIETVDSEEDLNEELLHYLQKKHDIQRVVVEYNGMWSLDTLYRSFPQEWLAYQETMFIDARTFLSYNQNMRQLMYDKLKSAELVIFNRCKKGFDKMEFHKIVRAANRRSQILYEYSRNDVEMDNIVDPLPFDLDAPIVEIGDDAYAEWYRDINEDPKKYSGKVIKVRGRSVIDELPSNTVIFGRHVMTCCVEDIQFAGLVGRMDDAHSIFTHGGWFIIEAEIRNEFCDEYGEDGPVLHIRKAEPAEEAVPEVAQF